MKVDFSNIHLLNHEYRNLLLLKRGKILSQEVVDKLRPFGFVDTAVTKWEKGVAKECAYSISDNGLRYIEYRRDQRSDRRWTRWLSIIAIVISVLALSLEVYDRNFFGLFEAKKTGVEQSLPKQSELPEYSE